MIPWTAIALSILGGWIYGLLFDDPLTLQNVVSIILGLTTYQVLQPFAIVVYKNYRKEPYYGSHQDR